MNLFGSTFAFQGLRIDEALRLYLEAFRLPGEAPVIQRLLETFTDNWHVRPISLASEKCLNGSVVMYQQHLESSTHGHHQMLCIFPGDSLPGLHCSFLPLLVVVSL